MRIPIVTATGEGKTGLAAFDHALTNAGIENRNLLRLSSVIPPNSEIVPYDTVLNNVPGDWGDRLYVVYAERRAAKVGEQAWAGIGWAQNEEDGRGLFVEHEGPSEHSVISDINLSLKGLLSNRNIIDDSDWNKDQEVIGIECTESGIAVCALAVAVYQASDWDNNSMLVPVVSQE